MESRTHAGVKVILAGIYYRAAKGTVQYVATRNQIITPTGCDDRAFGIMAESGGTLASPVPLAVTIQNNSLRSFWNRRHRRRRLRPEGQHHVEYTFKRGARGQRRDSDRRGYRVSDRQLD